MCGILLSCCRGGATPLDNALVELIKRRGPDSFDTVETCIPSASTSKSLSDSNNASSQAQSTSRHPTHLDQSIKLTLSSSVLALRGQSPVRQPLRDGTGSQLAWNGEAWRVGGATVSPTQNDAKVVFDLLAAAAAAESGPDSVCRVLGSVAGPFAFAFYAPSQRRLYYGRDPLGRRSLVVRRGAEELYVASVGGQGEWSEVAAEGVYCVDLASVETAGFEAATTCIEWQKFKKPFPPLSRATPWLDSPYDQTEPLHAQLTVITPLSAVLHDAVATRLVGLSALPIESISRTDIAPLAVLFSGGLDCSILARMAHDILPAEMPIDLLNVAFENPRVVAAATAAAKKQSGASAPDSPYERCPDRITGRATHAELVRVCPGRRWNFVAIDVPYATSSAHRSQVVALMHPHDTEMDLSIALALYFASRGEGTIRVNAESEVYSTTAKVLLSGLGADELFGGYSRHGAAFERSGDAGLAEELDLDFGRIGQRNLGRDDRVVAHWGREVRYPFLDENVVEWALLAPVRHKCDFAYQSNASRDPAKGALREVARRLAMENVAEEKKRAIQFGSRTAKMTQGRVKGTERLASLR